MTLAVVRWSGRVLVMAAVTCTVVVGAASGAAAHANVVGSTPGSGVVVDAAPTEVVVRFDEAVAVDLGSGIRVFGPAGARVDRGRTAVGDGGLSVVAPVDAATPGTYTVAWRVVSEDSHVLSGSFLFHVQRETGAAGVDAGAASWRDGLGWLARWWIALAVTVVGGLVGLRGGGGSGAVARLRAVVVALAMLGLAGAVLRFEVQVVGASGRSYWGAVSLWRDAVTSTRAGRLDAARAVAFVALVVAGVGWRRRWGVALAGMAVAAVVLINALEGHAWSADERLVATAADVVHQVAVCLWVGGLVGVALVGAEARRTVAVRFSKRAAGALGVVVATGVVATVVQFGTSVRGLDVAYGRVLAVKVVLVAVMAMIGWRNRSMLGRVAAASDRFGRGVAAEVLVSVAVLGLTAALVGMVPARSLVAGGSVNGTVDDGRGAVSVTVNPARLGENTMHLYFFDQQQRPRQIDAVEVRVAVADVPARVIDVEPVTQGHFVAASFTMPSRGVWTFSVVSVTRGEVAKFNIEVKV